MPTSCSAGCPGDFGTFVSNLAIALDSFVDSSAVYVGDSSGELFRTCKTSGMQQRIGQITGGVVTTVVIDGGTAYFGSVLHNSMEANGGAISSVSTSGGQVTELAAGIDWVVDIAVDATHVYWATSGTAEDLTVGFLPDGRIQRVPRGGGAVETVASGQSALVALALDDTHVYFTSTGETRPPGISGLRRVAKTGGQIQTVLGNLIARNLVLQGEFVYLTAGARDTGQVLRVAKTGGDVDRLYASGLPFAQGLALIGDQLYFVSDNRENGSVQVVNINGGAPALFQDGLELPSYLSVDECALYISTRRTVEAIER